MSRKISRRSFLTAALTASAATALSLTACADKLVKQYTELPDGVSDSDILVVYFSHSSAGNTRSMAQNIANATGGSLFELEASDAYADGYGDSDRAQAERDENARPAIANLPASLDQYSTIFIGYPIWWHTAPMIIGTFLESFDLTDKGIYVFAQSASMDEEQFNNSMEFVRDCAAGANVHDGLFARTTDTEAIEDYLVQNGFIA